MISVVNPRPRAKVQRLVPPRPIISLAIILSGSVIAALAHLVGR